MATKIEGFTHNFVESKGEIQVEHVIHCLRQLKYLKYNMMGYIQFDSI
jgi:hypothetical protein